MTYREAEIMAERVVRDEGCNPSVRAALAALLYGVWARGVLDGTRGAPCDCKICGACGSRTLCAKCGRCARHDSHILGCPGCPELAEVER